MHSCRKQYQASNLLPIPDGTSQKKTTLFNKLKKMQKFAGMTSEQEKLFEQLNIVTP